MAQTIKLKRSSTAGNVPSTADLSLGEIAINTADGAVYIKKNDGSDSIVAIHDDDVLKIDTGNSRIGIGKSNPTVPLDVVGQINASGHIFSSSDVYAGGNTFIFGGSVSNGDYLQFETDKVKIYSGGTAGLTVKDGGNVGVGTDSPTAKLDINGPTKLGSGSFSGSVDTQTDTALVVPQTKKIYSLSSSGQYLRNIFYHDGGNGHFIFGQQGTSLIADMIFYPGSSGNIRFYGSGSEDVRINASGLMGIGTTSPSKKLEVVNTNSGSNFAGIQLRNNTTTADSSAELRFVISTDTTSTLNSGFIKAIRNAGDDNDLTFGTVGAERMRIDNSGNVGIGTTSPSATYGGKVLHIENNDNSAIKLHDTTGSQLDIAARSGDVLIYEQDGYPIRFGINGTEGMRLTSTGLGIGTTSPSEKLSIAPDTDVSAEIGRAHIGAVGHSDYAAFSHVDKNTTGNFALMQHGSGETYLNASSGTAINFRLNNSAQMRLTSTGLGIGTTSPDATLELSNSSTAPTLRISNESNIVAAGGDLGIIEFYSGDNSNSGDSVQASLSVIQPTTDNVSGEFVFKTSNAVENSGALTERLRIAKDGAITFNNAYTFPTADGSANQVLQTDGSGNLTFATVSGSGVTVSNNANNRVLTGDGTNANAEANLTFDGSTLNVTGGITATGNVSIADSQYLYFGASNDFFIQHNTTNTILEGATGDIIIQNNATDKDIVFKSDDGSGGLATYITIDGSASLTKFNINTKHLDNVKATFGDSADLEIYHTGNHSYITDTGTGNLYIRADSLDLRRYANGEQYLTGDANGAVTIFYDGSAKLATKSDGVDITGELQADSLDIDGAGDISGNLAVGGNTTITGNLTVNGSTVTNSATNTTIEDALIELGSGNTGANSNDLGLILERGTTGNNIFIGWDESEDKVAFGTTTATGSSTGNISYSRASILANALDLTNHIDMADNAKIRLGASDDLQLFHNGSSSIIRNDTGHLDIKNGANDADIRFMCDDGSGGEITYFLLDGSTAKTQFNRHLKIIDDMQIQIGTNPDLFLYHDQTNSYIQNTTGNLDISNTQDDGDILFKSDNGSGGVTEYFRLDGSLTKTYFEQNVQFNDSVRLQLGAGADLVLNHNGSNSFIQSKTGNLYIDQEVTDGDILFRSDNGSGGVTEYFRVDGGTERIEASKSFRFADSVRAQFGASSDLQIYHDGSHTYINNGTGHVYFQQSADDMDIVFQCDDGSGGVTAYMQFDGSATEIDILQHVKIPDGKAIYFGTGNDLNIFHNGSHSYVDHIGTGNLYIRNTTNDADISFQSDDGSGGVTEYFRLDGGLGYNISPKHILFNDNAKARFGDAGDLDIYHNGSHSNIQETGTGNLRIAGSIVEITKNDFTETMAKFTQDGAAELYHNNSKKFETTSGGVTVTGNVTHSGLTMTSGTDIDQLTTTTVTATLSTSWQDTGIDGTDLQTGTYIIQVFVDDHSVGGNHYDEYYSGIMSWTSASTNSTVTDEILLHRAGHAPNSGDFFLRTQRAANTDTHDLMLQMRGATSNTGNSDYIFKFRRMI
jgi:hypothetical protein